MLTENSLTNTLTLSGINNIRYRVYTEFYQKTNLLSFLTRQEFLHTKSPSYVETEKPEIKLITAFRHLLSLNIPSSWHVVPCAEKDFICLELWVFWFDDRHTGLIDIHTLLKDLKEVKVGSFNWDQLSSSGLSPSASPQLGTSSSNKTNMTASLTPGNEYKLFIKSMRNLIHTFMIDKKKAFALGEFYIYPNKQQQQDIIEIIADGNESLKPSIQQNSMLACMYNIYLTSSNMVFQPNARRMRIRPLIYQDGFTRHKKVLLCPTGEHAYLISFKSLPTIELQEQVLNHWAEFYHLSTAQLRQQQQQQQKSSSNNEEIVPFLVTIKTASDEIITYPSRLIFVPTDTKLTPSSVSGLNGIMGYNHGLAEDLGAKISRLSQQNNLDYWSWHDPKMYSSNVIIQALSMMDTTYQQDQILLHRALLEPVISSPIMSMKSVIPIHTTPYLLGNKKTMTHSSANCNVNLVDFAKSQFQLQKEESVEAILDGPNPLDDPTIAIHSIDTQSTTSGAGTGSSHVSAMQNPTTVDSNKVTSEQPTCSASRRQSIRDDVPMDDFSLIYDLSSTANHADPWDTNEDFGDLDLDVTEADFDFFKKPAPALASLPPPITTPNNILGVIPMDIVSDDAAVKEEHSSLQQQEQQEVGNTMLIEETATQQQETEATPNNESLFTPFVMSNTNTEDVSMESSNVPTVEPSSTPYLPRSVDNATVATQKRSISSSYQIAAVESTTPSFVPRDFLPISVNTKDMDAKYRPGGKFMYDPSSTSVQHQQQQDQHQWVKKRESFYYTPDYVPEKKVARKRTISLAAQQINPSPSVTQDITMREASSPEDYGSSSTNGGSISDSSRESSSSFASSSEEEEEDLSAAETDLSLSMVDRLFHTLKKFQKSIVYRLLKATPAPQPTDRFQLVDYDTPFAPVLATDHDIKPIQWRSSQAMEQSLLLLCQQALGYPFTDLSELDQNGGEIKGEATKVMVARRTNLMQMTRGVVTHVPCLQLDQQNMILEFRDLLKQLFVNRNDKEGEEVMESAAAAATGGGPPRVYLNAPLLGTLDVKGPLTIQQYFDLGETQNQAHSKYGKYQIKKKRPDEPNLAILQEPNIIVSRYDELLEGKCTMMPFWEKIGLEPYSNKKQVQYLVMYPENVEMEETVNKFFKSLSTVYDDACRLGRHEALDKIGPYRQGLVPVPLLEENSVKHRLKSYEETCENLGRYLASEEYNRSSSPRYNDNITYIVIYMVNPGPHLSSYLDMCRCFFKLKEEYRKIAGNSISSHYRLVLQLIPIDHILSPSAFGGYSMLGLKEIAFSVYTKCLNVISQKVNSMITTDLYAPPFILEKPLQKTIQFKLNDIRHFPVILDQNSSLQMAYCFSYDRAWMSAVWVDGRGELLEYALFSRKTAFKEAWDRTLKIAKRTDFPWTIVVAKIGLLFHEELVHWLKYISSHNKHKYWVTIVGVDFESGLNLHFSSSSSSSFTTTAKKEELKKPRTSTLMDPYDMSPHYHHQQQQREQLDQKQYQQYQTEGGACEAQCLVLNHRISYSQKRERAFKGLLRTEAVTEKENWMTPLATGYFIHHSLPNNNINPCMEQFMHESFIAEIHLLYNHTPHSAYSTLHNIIKTMYKLSFVNPIPSSFGHHYLPFHIVLAERLSRLLLIVDDSIK